MATIGEGLAGNVFALPEGGRGGGGAAGPPKPGIGGGGGGGGGPGILPFEDNTRPPDINPNDRVVFCKACDVLILCWLFEWQLVNAS